MRLTKKIKEAIIAHAKAEYPKESCGLISNKSYIPCNNLATELDQFYIDPVDIVKAESSGFIDAYVHSHPDGSHKPSEVDLVQMSKSNKPWIICSYSPDEESEIGMYRSDYEYKAPLLGRTYFHGLQDCYSIVKDYYERELNINLNDYERIDKWWENEDTQSLYIDNFKNEGFIEVDNIQKHDVILFKLGRTFHVNHAGVFLADGSLKSEEAPNVIGNALFIHHPYNRQSLREIYGSYWSDRTAHILRHKDFL